jgi:hypothetical protein
MDWIAISLLQIFLTGQNLQRSTGLEAIVEFPFLPKNIKKKEKAIPKYFKEIEPC